MTHARTGTTVGGGRFSVSVDTDVSHGVVWLGNLADASLYPKRSLTTQYQESDLAFIERLLLEEGLFYWFEHSGPAADGSSGDSLGAHTLVIADHNGAFKPNARHDVRFSQSRGTIAGDTVDRWRPQRAWHVIAR